MLIRLFIRKRKLLLDKMGLEQPNDFKYTVKSMFMVFKKFVLRLLIVELRKFIRESFLNTLLENSFALANNH